MSLGENTQSLIDSMKKIKIIVFSAICLMFVGGVLLLVLNGLQNKKTKTADEVSVRMKWFYNGIVTGWFAGLREGFYEEAGIDLKIFPGGPDINAIVLVASGANTFGVAGADEVLMAREKGIPVVAIGVLFKDSPLCFISKKEKGIVSPELWTGKTIEVSYGGNEEIQYRAFKKKFNITDVKEVPYSFSLIPFIEGRVDITVAYLVEQVIVLDARGIQLNIQASKDYGINPYGDVIITSEKMINEQPELVRRFMQATIKSMKWAIENRESAVAHLLEGTSGLNEDYESKVWNATIPFFIPNNDLNQIGIMQPVRWTETKNMLVEFGFIPASHDESKAFTNQFVE